MIKHWYPLFGLLKISTPKVSGYYFLLPPFVRHLKGFYGYRGIGKILKGIGDTFVKIPSTFIRDIVIQNLLKWGEFWGYLPISF